MSEDDKTSEEDIVFENPDKKGKRNPPMFENEDHGITAWLDRDRNDNYFLRLRLPLGLGTVPIFVNDKSYEGIQENFNRLVDHLMEEREKD